jgi:hypothetical protein
MEQSELGFCENIESEVIKPHGNIQIGTSPKACCIEHIALKEPGRSSKEYHYIGSKYNTPHCKNYKLQIVKDGKSYKFEEIVS